MVFNPRLVASTRTLRVISQSNSVALKSLESSPFSLLLSTSEVALNIRDLLIYCVADRYCITHVIIASGGDPTEQSQSSPNQPTHVASLRFLDLNTQVTQGPSLMSAITQFPSFCTLTSPSCGLQTVSTLFVYFFSVSQGVPPSAAFVCTLGHFLSIPRHPSQAFFLCRDASLGGLQR